MWAKQEGEGAQAPFTASGTPTHQASKGRMRPTHGGGREDWLEAIWRWVCSFCHPTHPTAFPHPTTVNTKPN